MQRPGPKKRRRNQEEGGEEGRRESPKGKGPSSRPAHAKPCLTTNGREKSEDPEMRITPGKCSNRSQRWDRRGTQEWTKKEAAPSTSDEQIPTPPKIENARKHEHRTEKEHESTERWISRASFRSAFRRRISAWGPGEPPSLAMACSAVGPTTPNTVPNPSMM